jgi:excisionase family DNA binding protein
MSEQALAECIARLETKIDELRTRFETIAPAGRDAMSISEAADLTGWKPATLRMWCREGKIPAKRIDGIRDAWEIQAAEVAKLPRKRKTSFAAKGA